MKVHALPAKMIAEFVGTFFLIAAGLGVYMNGGELVAVAFAHGLAIAVGVTAIGHVSGGHLNPAITIAVAAFRKMPLGDAVAYVIAQLLGAYAAAVLVWKGFGGSAARFAESTPALGNGISVGGGILLETIATFFLVWTVFSVAIDKDGAFGKVAGLPIGLSIVVGIFMIGGATGAALNPARWFGPALMTGSWDNWIVWIAGPLLGGLAAGALHLYGIRPRLTDDVESLK